MESTLYTLAVILIFGAMIFFHEAGHFLVAKLSRIPVYEFAMGLGPVIFSFKRRGTQYSLRAIPFGGMVRVAGMEPEDIAPDGFNSKPRAVRVAVIAAGPIMNVVLAAAIFCVTFTVLGVPKDVTADIAKVIPGRAAAAAGLKDGDRLVEVNGVSGALDKLQEQIRGNPGRPLKVVVNRQGQRISVVVTPRETAVQFMEKDKAGEKVVTRRVGQVGIVFQQVREHLPVRRALSLGLQHTWNTFEGIFKGLSLVLHKRAPADLRGPVGIVSMLYDEAQISWFGFLLFAGMLNVMIAFTNLLPLPALDGSRIAFLGLEAVRGKPIDPRREALIHTVGLILILLFALVITVGDIWRRWGPQ